MTVSSKFLDVFKPTSIVVAFQSYIHMIPADLPRIIVSEMLRRKLGLH
jgi:hypothetical protein